MKVWAMNSIDLNKYAMASIASYARPVYICGQVKTSVIKLLRYFKEFNLACAGLFTDKDGPAGKDPDRALHLSACLGIPILPVSDDILTMPPSIIIYAGDLVERDALMGRFSASGRHIVIDAQDLFCYPSWNKCQKYYRNPENLLLRCRTCPANYRHCPLLAQQKGPGPGKSITRLLLRCGFVCNNRCAGCSQFIPYFKAGHKKHFDGTRIMDDLHKLASALLYIRDLWLEGGEAMLWQPFPRLLRCALALDNVAHIFVLSNGTYVPRREVLAVLGEYSRRVKVEINAYPGNGNLSKVMDAFDHYGVNFMLRPEISGWTDFRAAGFRGRSLEELRDIKNKCLFFKRNDDQWMLTDGKLSAFCCEAGYVIHYLNLYAECENDYIDIRQLPAEAIATAMGKLFRRSYLEACNYCPGKFAGASAIRPAVQLGKE
ncbi:MAG: radical SAM protein [Desulfarculales bacterium]|jgi:hypothetical protein|nr:radical SAM protein [Desulfarculales bacterium]